MGHDYFKNAYMKLYDEVQQMAKSAAADAGRNSECKLKMMVSERVRPNAFREAEIAAHMANGLHTKEIAQQMGLSPRTVETLSQAIRYRYGAKTPAQLVAIFFRNGWIK